LIALHCGEDSFEILSTLSVRLQFSELLLCFSLQSFLQLLDRGIIDVPATAQSLVSFIAESMEPSEAMLTAINLDVGNASLIQTVTLQHLPHLMDIRFT
jgi:hypothetical protein